MKKRTAIRELLGLTQLEMAMLLGVARSRIAMYEQGSRDLPDAAIPLLQELFSSWSEPGAASALHRRPQSPAVQLRWLEDRRTLVAHQHDVLARQCENLRQQIRLQAQRTQLIAFLDKRQAGSRSNSQHPNLMLRTHIDSKSTDPPTELGLLELQLEALSNELSWLESKHNLLQKNAQKQP